MRAVKSVLVMAGSLKRQNPDKPEDVVLIRALRDSNLPKFLVDDAVLFQVGLCYYCSSQLALLLAIYVDSVVSLVSHLRTDKYLQADIILD